MLFYNKPQLGASPEPLWKHENMLCIYLAKTLIHDMY